MANLIDREALVKEIESVKFSEDAKKMNVSYDEQMDGFFKGLVEGMIGFMPYTTEAEIRAKAITEFAEKMNARITEFVLEHQEQLDFVSGVGMGWKFVDEIATELKGE